MHSCLWVLASYISSYEVTASICSARIVLHCQRSSSKKHWRQKAWANGWESSVHNYHLKHPCTISRELCALIKLMHEQWIPGPFRTGLGTRLDYAVMLMNKLCHFFQLHLIKKSFQNYSCRIWPKGVNQQEKFNKFQYTYHHASCNYDLQIHVPGSNYWTFDLLM